MSYIGSEPTTAAFPFDQFSGNGSTTAFTLTYAPASTTSIIVAISGVMQNPNLYSVIGTTLTFSPAPPTGTNNISVLYLGLPVIGSSSPGNTAFLSSTDLTATAGQTVFASAGSYTPGFVQVFRNGARLGNADFTATNGTTITLANAATAGDLVTIEYYTLTSLTNALPLTGGTVTGSTTFNSTVTVNGAAVSGFTGMKNRIINGNMVLAQRGTSFTAGAGSLDYTLDRWAIFEDTDGVCTIAQDTSVYPVGFTNSLKFTTTTADASLGAAQRVFLAQRIEGFNSADLAWGTANAATVTLSFWVRSTLTGTFGGALENGSFNRSYPFTYTISAANTWEQKSVTIAGDTSGTWATGNTLGIQVAFGLGVGTDNSGTAGAWAASNLQSATGATSVIGTLNATWQISGVQLEKGSTATSFEFIDYGRQLAQCQRYFYKTTGGGNTRHAISGNGGLSQSFPTVFFKVTMRTVPTVSVSSVSHFNTEALNGAGSVVTTSISYNAGDTDSMTLNVTSAGSGGAGCNLLGNSTSAVIGYSAEL